MNHEELRRRRELFRSLIDNVKLAMNRGDWKAVVWWMNRAQDLLESLDEDGEE